MKKAGLVLGVVGGSLAILWSLLLLFGGIAFWSMDMHTGFNPGWIFGGAGILGLIAGGLGLAGGILINKKKVLSGVFLIIAAALSLFAYFQIISMILFILAGVFALVNESSVQSQQQPQIQAQPQPQLQAQQKLNDDNIIADDKY